MRLLLVAALLAATPPHAPPQFVPPDVPEGLKPALDRAERAILASACAVEERFGEGDSALTAARCKDAKEQRGVEVGRTSARLRNPDNAAPAWARAYVEQTDHQKASAVKPAAFDLGDRVGLLKPIAIEKRCLHCHASADQLAPETRSWLRREFPHDRALGYALGDLRGFWWAEAKKAP
jgi:hypothetical protein